MSDTRDVTASVDPATRRRIATGCHGAPLPRGPCASRCPDPVQHPPHPRPVRSAVGLRPRQGHRLPGLSSPDREGPAGVRSRRSSTSSTLAASDIAHIGGRDHRRAGQSQALRGGDAGPSTGGGGAAGGPGRLRCESGQHHDAAGKHRHRLDAAARSRHSRGVHAVGGGAGQPGGTHRRVAGTGHDRAGVLASITPPPPPAKRSIALPCTTTSRSRATTCGAYRNRGIACIYTMLGAMRHFW